MTTNNNITANITRNAIDTLNDSLSKSFIKILTTLYRTPKMTQKVLAASIQTSPSSLSNIIARMNTITPQLLTSERNGRTVYYSLTAVAKYYVEQELIADKIDHTSSFIVNVSADSLNIDTPTAVEAKRSLSQFQEKAGNNWIVILYNYIGNELNDSSHGRNSLDPDNYNLYKNFMNSITQLKLQKDDSSINQLYSILDNEILIQRMEAYFDKRLEIYYNLLPLLNLVDSGKEDSQKKAFMLIEYIFTEIKSSFAVQQTAITKYPLDLPVDKDEFRLIQNSIQAMIKDFFHYDGNVLQALNYWQKQFFTTNACLYFIVLECQTIYSIYHTQKSKKAVDNSIDAR